MLNIKDQECFEELSAAVRNSYPDAGVWAFGSRVRGGETADSDLDICVVLPNVDWVDRTKISDIAWEIGFERDRMISTIVFSKDQFDHGPCSASPIVKSIRDEGVAA